jgi:RNA ligase
LSVTGNTGNAPTPCPFEPGQRTVEERSTMNLYDLFSYTELDAALSEGLVKQRLHPKLPLAILDYTDKATYSRTWNTVTRNCRGLIYDTNSLKILARPFPKFFNYGEATAPELSLDEPVIVTDKLDGSMGILYPEESPLGLVTFSVATRGSFVSNQAIHATKIWRERYAEEFQYRINPRLTYLFEIIYPGNRIVVDYGDLDDLALIGAVNVVGGFVYGPEMVPGWPGPRATVLPYRTLREAVHARPRAGKEGMVVRSLMDGSMVKIKQQDYIELHRIVTGLNEKAIWERCRDADLRKGAYSVGDPINQVLEGVPDELHSWVRSVAEQLFDEVYDKRDQVYTLFARAQDEVDPGTEWRSERGRRKALALWLQSEGLPAGQQKGEGGWLKKAVFQVYDGYDPNHYLWKLVRPEGDVRAR